MSDHRLQRWVVPYLFELSLGGLVLAGILTVVIWVYVTNRPPHVEIPTPVMPVPNAFDTYQSAIGKLVSSDSIDSCYLDLVNLQPANSPQTIGRSGSTPVGMPGAPGGAPLAPKGIPSTQPPVVDKAKLVIQNAPVLAIVRKAFLQEYHQPAIRHESDRMAYLTEYRRIAKLLVLTGQVEQTHGHRQEALRCDLDAMQIGAQIMKGCPSWWIGNHIQVVGRRALRKELDHLNAAQARFAVQRLEHILAQQVPVPESLQEAKWELLSTVQQDYLLQPSWRSPKLGTGGPTKSPTSYLGSKQRIIDNLSRYMDTLIETAKQRYPTQHLIPIPNDPYSQAFLEEFSSGLVKAAGEQTTNRLLLIALALHAYHAEHGRYPTTLAELTPSYLHAIPADPFALSGSPQYQQKDDGYLLYSVGPNGTDDGGRSYRHFSTGLDKDSKGDIVAGDE